MYVACKCLYVRNIWLKYEKSMLQNVFFFFFFIYIFNWIEFLLNFIKESIKNVFLKNFLSEAPITYLSL